VHDAGTSRHPLAFKVVDHAPVAQAVPVLKFALDQVGDGLYAPVWMPGETLEVIVGVDGVKTVQHQKRVERTGRLCTQHPPQADAGAINRPLSSDNPGCFALVHKGFVNGIS